MVCITPHGPREVWGLREKQLWGTDSLSDLCSPHTVH